MKNISKLQFISELSEAARQKKRKNGICLFLGAGADISSGGINFFDLKKEVVSFVRGQAVHEYESLDYIDKEFDNIMESLDENGRCMVIRYMLERSANWTPSDGYKLLVLLARENCVSSVITTNFANLLEKTQQLMGVDAFHIYTPATAIPSEYFLRTMLPKAVYLKIHGDIDGKFITHLTSAEIQTKEYQREFVALFQHLIKSESIVFLGYSGWDTKIAEIFEKNISSIKNVYWCNIKKPDENAPLIKVFRENNVTVNYINYNFDEAIKLIAIEFFKDLPLFHIDSVFIESLITSKIEKLQLGYMNNLESERRIYPPILRTKANIFDSFIWNKEKNFCVVTGNSGIGKSMLILELCEKYRKNEQVWIIPLNAMITFSNDILDYITKKIGYISQDSYTVLYQFARWASEQEKQFIFVIDNLGNHIGNFKEIAVLLNRLIELAYAVRNYHNVKFVISLRTNIWNNVYQLLDTNYLSAIIWNEKNNNYAVRLGNFDEYELRQAKDNILTLSNSSYVPNDILELIKEPSLYGLIRENVTVLNNIAELNLDNIFEKTFLRGISKIFLEELAYSILGKYVETHTPPNYTLLDDFSPNNDMLANILSVEENKIEFKNDLILEYCLSSKLTSLKYIHVFLHHIDCFEQEYLTNNLPSPIYYGIIRYLGVNCKDFGQIVRLICILLDSSEPASKFVTKFVNDVFKYMAQYAPTQYSNNILHFDTECSEFEKLLPYLIHSVGFMGDAYAFQVLTFLKNKSSSSYPLECNALINDRFSLGIRKSNTSRKCSEYFKTYVKYILVPDKPLRSLFSLLWLMGRIGKDNTNHNIYELTASLILSEIRSLHAQVSINGIQDIEVEDIKELFLENAYFIFFNADNNLEEKYFLYPSKSKTISMFNQIRNKSDLTQENLLTIRSLVDHFDETIEFFVCNMLFVYMAVCEPDYALKNLDALYNSFNENTSVLELDFYSSALFMSSYIVNPMARETYLERYNRLIEDFEVKMFISPSMQRVSSCRKFEDKFEIEFEDGFNILTDYTYTAPMCNYIRGVEKKSINTYLSAIWKLLEILEQDCRYDEMIRLIQAINQMSVNWPEEALEALGKFSKYNHPILRKAVIRTLEENYLRYPNITIKFLEQTGEAFTEDELLQIYSATNSQIENRTLEQLQWARIIHFINNYLNSHILDDIFVLFSSTNTLNDAFKKIIESLLL